ncbi:Heh2p KNAG_0C02820 [Huiozyma naganishii CBS 8797]|uniref:Inner nuclear membrane protein SRC1 n=1 Tax=Huiozyma naganishii (strain ATCC MYA-139 / BCRC 22969 / CBS 8797 / KCTC 17520 / NBRC 10181 / NCYC 3082 / Yp74L-3) TaxID=1071383 RepID=J7RIP4_HUIN7|nr:hypothetical protein KNAG_0C02820 [Kazachstania naganishii CBS 8797]CCK69393.1 hypothetical protein KNAG_0C02820 [Kazachstania naganishii CBS 8797]
MEYLEHDFDPKTWTVSQLRGVLVENGVELPSKVKKQQLVRLFNKEIVPKRKDLRKRHLDVKPNDHGINVVETNKTGSPIKRKRARATDSTQDGKQGDDTETKKKKPKKAKKTLRSERAKLTELREGSRNENKVAIETLKPNINKLKVSPEFAKQLQQVSEYGVSSADEIEKLDPAKKDTSRIDDSHRPFRDSNTEPYGLFTPNVLTSKVFSENASETERVQNDENYRNRKGRHQIIQPSKVHDEVDSDETKLRRRYVADLSQDRETQKHPINNNSYDHPIEVLSEEEDEAQFVYRETSGKKKVLLNSEIKETLQVNTESGTKQLDEDSKEVILKQNLEKKALPPKKSAENGLENRDSIISFARAKSVFLGSIQFVAIASVVLWGVWYREQRIAVGFCHHELPLKKLCPDRLIQIYQTFVLDLSFFDSILEKYAPKCIDCPENAMCFSHMRLICDAGYIAMSSWKSLNGLLPINGHCIKDMKKDEILKDIFQSCLEDLRMENAEKNCGEGENNLESGISSSILFEKHFRKVIEDQNWSTYEGKQLWGTVLDKLKGMPEVSWSYREDELVGINLRSHSRKYIGFGCRYGRHIKNTVMTYQHHLIGLIVALLVFIIVKKRVKSYKIEQDKIRLYTENAIDRLKKSKLENNDPPFVHTVQLRDVILADVADLHERNEIWGSMVKRMDKDKNVLSSQMEIHGEIMRCWMWTGDLAE